MVGKKTTKTQPKPINPYWRLALHVLAPPAVGGVSALLTMSAMARFKSLEQPAFAPPAWLFPVVWTILYALMGVASFLVSRAGAAAKDKQTKLRANTVMLVYFAQLFFNFAWCIIFFNLGWYWFSFFWLMALWALVLTLMILAGRLNKWALWCLLPYALWCTFAAYLNCGIAILN